jgi:hypothetical protein
MFDVGRSSFNIGVRDWGIEINRIHSIPKFLNSQLSDPPCSRLSRQERIPKLLQFKYGVLL